MEWRSGDRCKKQAAQEFLSAENGLEFRRRKLPHWSLAGSTYFVTFRLRSGKLSRKERLIVLNRIRSGDRRFYSLIGATVMPDHVHLLLAPVSGVSLSRILKGIKGASARELNSIRRTRGTLWQDEYFDRIVRDQDELNEKLNYMLRNPLEYHLCEDPFAYDGCFFAGLEEA